MLLFAAVLTRYLSLYTLDWLLQSFLAYVVIALIVLFQPEIRRALAKVGQGAYLQAFTTAQEVKGHGEILRAVADMAVTLPTDPHTVMVATLLHRRHLTVTVVVGTIIRAIRRRKLLPLYLMKSAPRLAANRVRKAKENV